jgi:hypothetical protein
MKLDSYRLSGACNFELAYRLLEKMRTFLYGNQRVMPKPALSSLGFPKNLL